MSFFYQNRPAFADSEDGQQFSATPPVIGSDAGSLFSEVETEEVFDWDTEILSANHYWTADSEDNFIFSTGNQISQWNDLGSDSKNLVQGTSSLQPLLVDSYVQQKSSGTGWLQDSGLASYWDFLINQSTSYVLLVSGKIISDNYSISIKTTDFSGSRTGITITVGANNNKIQVAFRDAHSTKLALASVDNSVVTGEKYVFALKYDLISGQASLVSKSSSGVSSVDGNIPNILNSSNWAFRRNFYGVASDDGDYIATMFIVKERKSEDWVLNAVNSLYGL